MREQPKIPGVALRWRGHVPMAPESSGEGAGPAGAGAVAKDAAAPKTEAKAEPAKAEAKPSEKAPEAKVEATKVEAKPAEKAPEAKVEAKPTEPVKTRDEEILERVAAVEKRIAREKRDAAIAYLTRVPSVLTDEQLRAMAPDLDASTSAGRAALDQWREKNANLFRAGDPRPDQRVAELEKRIITDKTDPVIADQARRLMKSLWSGK